jgi:hypothetical protein
MTDRSEPPQLPEYAGNPFIAALPALLSQRRLLERLSLPPIYNSAEQSFPAMLRKHCVLRLGRMFHPTARQVALAEQIGMQIRQGYIGRNPADNGFIAHLQDGAERIEQGSLDAHTSVYVRCTAGSLALAGCSGGGKSLTVEHTLALYPQTIRHEAPFSLVQLVWIKLDCPAQGSPKQLCINFFAEVDRLVGTDYLKRYGGQSHATDWMLLRMAQVARLHAVGVLVVDEVQNLRRTATGPEALLNFLVMLINTIGIPVFLIGTLGALPVFQRNFRQARRSAGVGSAIWDRMPRGHEWDAFVEKLWGYQWTRTSTPLSQDVRDVLYDESQGIVDIVVKLFMLAQLRVIALGEVRRTFDEALTVGLFRQIAKEHLAIVRPMINALRSNDTEELSKFDDLVPLQAYVDGLVASALLGDRAPLEAAPTPPSAPDASAAESGPEDHVERALVAHGVAPDVARALMDDLRGAPDIPTDPLDVLGAALDRLRSKPASPTRKKGAADPKPPLRADDLRAIVAGGSTEGSSAYECLRASGVIGLPLLAQQAA